MKKKVLSVLLASAMTAAVLAGCGQDKETEKAGETPAKTEAVTEEAKTEAAETEKKTEAAETEKKTEAAETGEETEAGTEEETKSDKKIADKVIAESETKAETGAKTDFKVDKLTVGFDQDFPPMGFIGDDGEYTGFDLELAAEVADRLGAEVVYQPIAWDMKDAELSSGNIDCIWNGFTMTDREDEYTWSEPYMKNDQVFVVRADSGIASEADLAGKVVDVQTDSSAQRALAGMSKLTESFGSLNPVADYNTAFMELEAGAVDAVAMDSVVANYQIEKRGADFNVLDESIAAEEYAIGFKKGNEELRDAVQEKLDEMAADGTLAEISKKWFGEDMTILGK
ncbi:amino acid ABC transporter substrate-binding protein [Murimonas intestini]|uniref:Polar amino acid transport system substrate-binding protein n=1 Tax=Murimonas intestini TaxID=1337051 RepID=A0AB73T7Q5_9FIRM|nr:amino acid ABC transporter substrate-binding protein [Murimonas intestini]MCR1839755.1 amino acid ABC transporter substrate-binding protein [Murimonas intestini]MCR1866597.1 amino acid ABC transporter substrate-binding protein [Murimonas intestini]MCR1884779.1 amino acid ABC transporter substrate-binding protein [Murimonas intestini]